jgi:hypothetical protein
MAYSAKKYWTLGGAALALGVTGITLVLWLTRNHTDPVSVGLFRGAIGLAVIGLAMRATSYSDEVQRQARHKRWFWGSLIGFAAMLPVVISLQTHKAWLDAAVQFFFHHPGIPPLYFTLGVMVPVMFQAVSIVVLALLNKLSRGPQP